MFVLFICEYVIFFYIYIEILCYFSNFTAGHFNLTVANSCRLATDFQQAFMKLLQDAEFEELSAQDLMLTYALNNDYLLTLPIYVDWKKASKSNAIIFRLVFVLNSLSCIANGDNYSLPLFNRHTCQYCNKLKFCSSKDLYLLQHDVYTDLIIPKTST